MSGEQRSISGSVEGTSDSDFSVGDWGQLGLAALIFGSGFLFMTVALRSIHPGTASFFKAALGAATLALIPSARCAIKREDWPRLVVASFVGMALTTLLFAFGQERISSAVAGMLVTAVPIFTALVAAVETRRFPTRVRLLGLVIGFGGVLLLGLPELTGEGTQAVGVLLALASVLAHSAATTIYTPLQQTYGSMRVAMWLVALSAVWLAPYGIYGMAESSVELAPVVSLAVMGIVGTGLVWAIYLGVIGRVGAVRASIAGYLVPIVALILGVVVLSETVELIQVIGVVIALVGGYLLSRVSAPVTVESDEEVIEVVHLDPSCATSELVETA